MVILTFGKYRDQNIDEVYQKDPNYCRWLSKQDHLLNDEIKDLLKQKFSDGDDSYILNFGKYKNKSINWIKANDPKYIDWLKVNEYVSKNIPNLKKELI